MSFNCMHFAFFLVCIYIERDIKRISARKYSRSVKGVLLYSLNIPPISAQKLLSFRAKLYLARSFAAEASYWKFYVCLQFDRTVERKRYSCSNVPLVHRSMVSFLKMG